MTSLLPFIDKAKGDNEITKLFKSDVFKDFFSHNEIDPFYPLTIIVL